jgi:hypothetical protein
MRSFIKYYWDDEMKEGEMWGRQIGRMKDADSIVVGKPEGKIPIGRPRRRWEDNIRIDLKEVWLEGVD